MKKSITRHFRCVRVNSLGVLVGDVIPAGEKLAGGILNHREESGQTFVEVFPRIRASTYYPASNKSYGIDTEISTDHLGQYLVCGRHIPPAAYKNVSFMTQSEIQATATKQNLGIENKTAIKTSILNSPVVNTDRSNLGPINQKFEVLTSAKKACARL